MTARLDRDGYLFFRGLLPPGAGLEVRRQILPVLDWHGWTAAGTDLMDGIADVATFAQVPREEIDFLRVFGRLFRAPVLPQPRTIARVMIPSEMSLPTPPHQDFIHIEGFEAGDDRVDAAGCLPGRLWRPDTAGRIGRPPVSAS